MTTAKDELMDKLGALCERLDRVLEALERLTGTYYNPNPQKHEFYPIQTLYGVQPRDSGKPPWVEPPSQSLYGVKPRGTSEV